MGKISVSGKKSPTCRRCISPNCRAKNHGCRQGRYRRHKEISKRCRQDWGVDTIIVFDTHWLVNSAYHINCADHFSGVYTSNELPHFIRDMTYDYDGNPELGQLIADEAVKRGVRAKAHNIPSLKLEYGTLVPMRYMNADKHFKVVSISAFCTVHDFADSRRLGEAIVSAIEKYDGTVAVLASGSLSHRFIDDQRAEEGMNSYTREFDRQMDERVVKLWREGSVQRILQHAAGVRRLLLRRGQHARHGDAAGHARLGQIRRQGGVSHRAVRQLRHRPGQRRFPLPA